MAAPYLDELRALTDQTSAVFSEARVDIECKHFFSGAAVYADGKIFMTLTPVGLAIKLPADVRDHLLAAGATQLQYFPNGPIKKDYVVLPDRIVRDMSALSSVIRQSLEFASKSSKE